MTALPSCRDDPFPTGKSVQSPDSRTTEDGAKARGQGLRGR